MDGTADFFADEDVPRARVALLLKHFSKLSDDREPWRIVYPLAEVLLLLTCATIASCDDFDEIAAWGEDHLGLLRRFAPFHNGIPCERWLRSLVNRVDPLTFGICFEGWIHALWPGRHDLIAIDGKTSRRTHDKRKGLKALHTLSAYATNAHLTLAQISVPEKTNEITAIPVLLDHLAEKEQLEGALVTIDAMGCQVEIAAKIVEHKADFLHWVLDVEFKDDLSRYRAGHGAKNMAVVRRFALGLLRANKSKGSIKTRRKSASWNTQFLLEILQMK